VGVEEVGLGNQDKTVAMELSSLNIQIRQQSLLVLALQRQLQPLVGSASRLLLLAQARLLLIKG
jgi:hypothetical protein